MTAVPEAPPGKQIRCRGGLLARHTTADGLIEFKCHHKMCTRGTDLVFHYYDPDLMRVVRTRRYQDPGRKF